ncbi:MAG: DNA polymerase III subunit alpha [Deltaproteobacteria bacterium]|nr:DNA polymerase III subunit alpha [Deltaproteobacteria bacterium]
MSFVHLHVHSQYSLLESTIRIKKLCERAQKLEMPAVALTDSGNLFGAAEFYFTAKDYDVKPLIGLDAYIAPKGRTVKGEDRDAAQMPNRRIVLLAQNHKGYQNLCKLSSIGYQEGFYYKPRLDWDVIKEYSENLIALTGGSMGEAAYAFTRFGADAALQKIRDMKEVFGDRLYLELNRTGTPEWNEVVPFLVEASKITGVPLVAANNIHYLDQADQIGQEVLICIGSNKTLHDESRYRLGSDQFYFKTPGEMKALFKDLPEACSRTLEVAERCDVKFKIKDEAGKAIYHLPYFTSDDGQAPSDLILKMTEEGLKERFLEAEKIGTPVPEEKKPEYHKRMAYELGVIDKMGFTSYFLIVQDFINWAKNNGIPVGPGRGSGAGSLVAYCLRITDLDPVPYSLLFERFLNPERISMPDFDIDFCQDRRQEVIQYVTKRYGDENVSQIITYGKLQTRAAIKDVGRVLGMTFAEVDVITKLIPEKLGITIDEAIADEPRLREQIDQNPQIANLIDLAKKIEGLVRNAGIHAAGVVIGDAPLVTYAPMYRGAADERVVQYDMKWAEKIGLIKFDFLGLKTLTHIKNCLDLIRENRSKTITSREIPIHDPGIYELMSKGDLLGVFQFEGDGITGAVKSIKPNCFEDITAINALYRPGPMDMIPDYTRKMHGEEEVEYLFPELEPILKETYGIIVYQEQVMAIASRIASYTLGEADLLRRAMGKKIAAEMMQQKERFMNGAAKNGFDAKKADELFELMAKFANYGFNKSHAAAYCVVSAQTAWLKRYYPVEFYAALLSTEMSNTDNIVRYVKNAQSRGIEVRPPHVNHSEYKFTVKGDTIFFSLGAIKGVGEGAVDAIVQARNTAGGKFNSLEQFFESVDIKKINKKVVECLIKAGAFEGFGYHQAQLMDGYERFFKRAEGARRDREVGQGSLFSMLETNEAGENSEKVVLENRRQWPRALKLQNEKEVLGFYLSDHPLTGLDKLFRIWVTREIAGLAQEPPDKRVVVAGLVTSFREIISKKGARMAFASLEDLTGQIELIVFPEAYVKGEIALKGDQPLLVGGQLKKENDSLKILVDRVAPLEDVLAKSKAITFKIDSTMTDKLPELQNLMARFPGSTGVELQMEIDVELSEKQGSNPIKKMVTMEVEEPKGIQVTNAFFEDLHGLFGQTDFVEIRG